ncbi:MAG: transporter substrate-binding domain-containing protein [Roseomonas sp.]|nr:transporter substrate-binding domain-containing protein [Roseomonas sp.]
MMMRVAAATAALLLSATTASAQPAEPGPTLSQVRQRGTLVCGIPPGVPGFGAQAAGGAWQGIEVDVCRAIAAAVLGDAQRASFTPLSSQARFPALQQRQVDVLTRAVTWTQSRDTQLGFNFGPVTFYDGQGFLTHRTNISRARDLQGRVASVKVVENVGGLEAATAQAALGGSCRVSLVSGGLSISPMASTPM